jgi:hypothetical protein
MKKIFFISLALFAILSCTTNPSLNLTDDPDVKEIFKKDEISSLAEIVQFFDDVIIENTKEKDVSKAYLKYFGEINKSDSFEDLIPIIGIANSHETKKLIDKLKNKGIYNIIWKDSYNYNYESKDTISLNMTLNLRGKYIHLLELLGENNDFIKKYVYSLQSSGCISPALISDVMKNFNKEMNFKKDVNRLIFAIHYITILSEDAYKKERNTK